MAQVKKVDSERAQVHRQFTDCPSHTKNKKWKKTGKIIANKLKKKKKTVKKKEKTIYKTEKTETN